MIKLGLSIDDDDEVLGADDDLPPLKQLEGRRSMKAKSANSILRTSGLLVHPVTQVRKKKPLDS